MDSNSGNIVAAFVALAIFTAVGQGCIRDAEAQLRAPGATMADLKAAEAKYKAQCWITSGQLFCTLPDGKTVRVINGEAQDGTQTPR